MRLLAVGDLHGNTDLLFRLLDDEKPDGVLGVGDWGDAGQIAPEIWDALLVRAPVATVFGNHDDTPFLRTLRNRDATPVLLQPGEVRDFQAVTLAGVSGIWAKSHKKAYWVTDEDVTEWAKQIHAAAPDGVEVLLTHGCPIGLADRTVSGRPGGQRCFLSLLQMVRPQIYLSGHLHVPQRRDVADPPCAVLNTGDLPRGSYVIVEKSASGVVSAELRFASPKETINT